MKKAATVMRRSAAILALGGLCSLSACAHFPARLAAPILPSHAPLDGVQLAARAGAAWPDINWWKRYQDPTLDELVAMSGASATSLNIARARFDTARQSVRETAAAVGAKIGLDADISRQRLSNNGLFQPKLLGFNWYNQADLGFNASYTFDWWGKQRNTVEAAIDSAQAAESERSASGLTVTSAIVDAYFGWQLDQSRLTLARQRVENSEAVQAIAAARVKAEIEPPESVDNARVAVGAAREDVAILEGSARLRIVAIAALVGQSEAALPHFTAKPLPAVDVDLPENVGIDLLARRADISASRFRVEAAQRSVASARAEFYPDVSIKALAGLSSVQISKLLEVGSGVPSASAAIHLPIFDAGRLQAQYGSRQAQVKAAVADYDDALVNAAKEVSTQVSTRQQLLAQKAQRKVQVDAAEKIRAAAQARVREGLTDLKPQLDAERSALTQRDALLQLDGAALSADIALQRALGGGYRDAPPSPTASNSDHVPKPP